MSKFTRINIDKQIAEDSKRILNKMGLTLSSAVSALLKNISQTGEFPIHLTSNYNTHCSVYNTMINDLLNSDFPEEDVEIIANRLSLWENCFDHEMNQKLAVILNAIFELKQAEGYIFNWNTMQPSSDYWLENLRTNTKYFKEEINAIQNDHVMTYETYLKLFKKTIDLLKNDPNYKFKCEIRCIQIPLRDWIVKTDSTVIKNYLETDNQALNLIQNIVELEKLMKTKNVELYELNS